ncbi:hypothetical protein CT676_37460 [Bradyrhizobium sp. MOS001]|uniref:hypothetical protein n=1 Tax=Bradyrhizobium sp. MOS001 TaxID=2133948 RepID=UPI001074C72C|nr:hypothetical protein [Bradyrhizobium sp. MOS001]TFW56002.1 hypothetical protein CT676_37460 [Bradyrhizobium sp. MOS001]
MSKTVLVCAALTPLHLFDNLAGRCADCGCGVQYRPRAPADARKLCFECALPSLEENDTKLVTTPRMVEDFQAYMQKKRH